MRVYQVDAFTDAPFRGNPAAVVIADRALTEEQMQTIAAEMNLSETSFILPHRLSDGVLSSEQPKLDNQLNDQDTVDILGTTFNLRWFTPTTEVSLCGHGTLAAAHALRHELGNKSASITFFTASGPLVVDVADDGLLRMQFPLNRPEKITESSEYIMNLVKLAVGNSLSLVEAVFFNATTRKLIIQLEGDHEDDLLTAISPDVQAMHALRAPEGSNVVVRGVSVSKRSTETGVDFVSRYFSPWNGISEDPVNGSSHTILAPLYAEQLGKQHLVARQLSARRGLLHLEVGGLNKDHLALMFSQVEDDCVYISGTCVTVLRGELLT